MRWIQKEVDFNISFFEDLEVSIKNKHSNTLLWGEAFDLNDTEVVYHERKSKVIVDNKLINKNRKYNLSFRNLFDLKNSRVNGKLLFNTSKKNRFNLDSEDMEYLVDYKNDLAFYIPKFGFEYVKKGALHEAALSDAKKLSKLHNRDRL